MARRIDIIKDGKGGYKKVDLGPMVPRKPIKKGPKKFTVYVHHKQREKLLPQWMLDNPDFTFKSTYKKRTGPIAKGNRSRTIRAYIRSVMKNKGVKAEIAAWEVAGDFCKEFPEKFPDREKLREQLLSKVRHK
jgi:hypothetical protein